MKKGYFYISTKFGGEIIPKIEKGYIDYDSKITYMKLGKAWVSSCLCTGCKICMQNTLKDCIKYSEEMLFHFKLKNERSFKDIKIEFWKVIHPEIDEITDDEIIEFTKGLKDE